MTTSYFHEIFTFSYKTNTVFKQFETSERYFDSILELEFFQSVAFDLRLTLTPRGRQKFKVRVNLLGKYCPSVVGRTKSERWP